MVQIFINFWCIFNYEWRKISSLRDLQSKSKQSINSRICKIREFGAKFTQKFTNLPKHGENSRIFGEKIHKFA